jgi:flagellar motor switch protein FliN/FliY
MSVKEIDIAPANEATAAVIKCLPAADLMASDGAVGPDAVLNAIPEPGSVAVSASLNGPEAHGSIVVVLASSVAESVENGPVGPQELVAALEPGLTDATLELAKSFGELKFDSPQKLEAEVALANAQNYTHISVVPMLANVAVGGSVVVLLKDGPNPNIKDEIPDSASFESLPQTEAMLTGASRAVELLNDVEMGVTAELGRTRMTVRELLSLQPGSVVELDRAAGSPVDLLVNGTLVARGEVVVVDEEFAIRVTEIIGYDTNAISGD